MPPKKKGNKKGNDDWEAELGENIDPTAAATQEVKAVDESKDAEEDGGAAQGGLLAAIRRNKDKKKKKGKGFEEDFVDGEDPPETNGLNGHGALNEIENLAAKAPEEATADDLFEAQAVKTKGGKGKIVKTEEKLVDEDGDSMDEGGKVKSKKEKEKEKKEREKQRKKEQV